MTNRLVARPPRLYRALLGRALWRLPQPPRRVVYLTFDDGPVPEVTPEILDILRRHGVPATFFMVGDNAARHPHLIEQVRAAGHAVANHTMHHAQSLHMPTERYLADVAEAEAVLGPCRLFRPPHGLLRPAALRALQQRYRLVMADVVARDYAASLSPEQVLRNVQRYTRPGSILVMHDSVKAAPRVLWALPRAVEWLQAQGFEFQLLPQS